MAKKEKQPKKAKPEKKEGRLKQMALVYSMTKKSDPRIGLILGGIFLGAAAVAFVLLTLVLPGSWVLSLVTAVVVGGPGGVVLFWGRGAKGPDKKNEGRARGAAAGPRPPPPRRE